MQPPGNAGSHYYNYYKLMHSIVLMAFAGPSYECLYADIGTNLRTSDGGVWNKRGMSKAIEDGICLYHHPSVCPWVSQKYPMFLWGTMLLH